MKKWNRSPGRAFPFYHTEADEPVILPQEAFHALVKHERRRADRENSVFSLIAFEVDLRRPGYGRRVADALRHRSRAIDAIGWLAEGCLSILLPATRLEGAWKFAVQAEERMMERFEPPPFTVYSYPDQWFEGWNRLASGSAGSSAGPAAANGHARGGFIDTSRASSQSGAAQVSRSVQERIRSVLAQPIPAWKRALDLTGSTAALLALSPLLLLISLYIRLVSPGPALYRQQRIGYRGMPFVFLKFRTMKTSSNPSIHRSHLRDLIHSDQPMQKLDQGRDDRIIPGGRFLRRTSLDELPQLFNVLRGRMSLVGPRPCIPYEAREYQRWHTERFDTLPGMTGLWQVSGKNHLTFKQMIRLDIAYAQRMSLWLDLKILALTVPTVLHLAVEGVVRRRSGSRPALSAAERTEPLSICQIMEFIAEKYPRGGFEHA